MFHDNYLRKRAVKFNNWRIFPEINKNNKFSSIIVIPSYQESKYIARTLRSLEKQIKFNLNKLLVIVVVNNSAEDREEILYDNLETIHLIKKNKFKYKLLCVDASTKGYSLPKKIAGVGYSRKIGMDFALKYCNEGSILHCMDADTIVSEEYLFKINQSYKKEKAKSVIVDFEHQRSNDSKLDNYIKSYEEFLKKTAADIHESGSPYGYVSLGPTITCLAKTYVKVGGMVNKKATEDFYFLQKIRKFTDIYFLKEVLVFPSSRLSDRVYLGTGFRMKQLIDGCSIENLYYSNKSYNILKKTITGILSMYRKDSSETSKTLLSIDPLLNSFFLNEGLFDIWDNINSESKTINQFELQFHKWFDNLKTLRLLKFYS